MRFRKAKVSFLVVKTVKCKRGISRTVTQLLCWHHSPVRHKIHPVEVIQARWRPHLDEGRLHFHAICTGCLLVDHNHIKRSRVADCLDEVARISWLARY